MRPNPRSLVRAAAISGLISAGGRRAGALSGSGAVAATAVGTAVLGFAGWRGAAMLGSLFVSGSLLSRLTSAPDVVAKGGPRDARQVLANGGVAALAALSSPLAGQSAAFAMLSGALAAATADTLATEWGMTAARPPRLVISGRRVPRGLSGGVTLRGTLGALAGAGAAACLASAVAPGNLPRSGRLKLAAITALAGTAGSALDSLLGELLQEKRWSREHRALTETPTYRGSPTVHAGGLGWVDNDLVNLACTLTGAFVVAVAVLPGPSDGGAIDERGDYFRS